jgi:hypothetical protein
MYHIFNTAETSLFIKLLIAHIATDFLLQTKKGIEAKQRKLLQAPAFWLHILYVCITAAIAMLGQLHIGALALITLSHLAIDYAKIIADKKTKTDTWKQKDVGLFLIDQLLHIIVLGIAWLFIIKGFSRLLIMPFALPNNNLLLKLLGYFIVIGPVTYLIKFLTIRWSNEITANGNSLPDAGKWIGILERIIVITFVFIDQYSAIGFLITAKSILRLIDKPDPVIQTQTTQIFSTRKHTEYVLIGTFLSFGTAILVGVVLNWIEKL